MEASAVQRLVASGWIITNTIWINGTNSFTHLYISLSSLNAQKILISGYAPFGFAVSYTFLLNQNTLQSGFGCFEEALSPFSSSWSGWG